ncbi:iron complex transport system ATP-binding protein [Rhizobium sp. ERR 922]|uniref:ABC transporter ATP-binding protein n=1 Tax=unclassified Rhizobium TaxID=2613769 RepID=UPI0011A5A640|nr:MULTISPECIES: ABC transporter ATP-binding protein [unclassified Rhizobium]TWB61725.1 iron complex transport system ATP-binding protein [Rhizobium sp. ERR 922]TWC04651.1 iron complex transport system ATP-binding protein [Rhizobium sp. ERR 942]
MSERSARLEADGISWGPQKGMPIISSITLSVEAGARLAIIGPNGAGKSTLLRCLYRGLKPQRGSVRLDGIDLWSIGPREAAQRIAVVPQETPGDFPFSVRDVVLMGRIPHRKGMARWSDRDHEVTTKALARLELESLAQRQFASLSGGEKQRTLIARALAQEPELIILDEPTNHLDIRHQLEILELLKRLGPTIITTLHDINLAADFATQIAVMDCGRLMGHGEPAEVLTVEHVSNAFRVGTRLHRTDGGPQRFSFSLR